MFCKYKNNINVERIFLKMSKHMPNLYQMSFKYLEHPFLDRYFFRNSCMLN